MVVYEDEELRKELDKLVGDQFYPLSDVPEIQAEYLRQMDEEREKEKANKEEVSSSSEVATLTANMGQVSLNDGGNTVATLEQRQKNTLPVREKPERSVRLMKEKGMLRKYS